MRTWLTRNLLLLTLVSLAQDAASELIYPLLPLLIVGVVGSAPLVIGLIEGLAEFAAGFTKLYSGKWSDRFGRKRFVVAGYSLTGIGKVFTVTALSWPGILLGRVSDRIGKGLRGAPRDALIHDGVDDKDLGKAFGFHRTGDNLGAVIGPLLALILLAVMNDDVRAVAKIALIPALISALLTFFVRDVRKHEIKGTYTRAPLSPELKKTIRLLVIIQLTNIPDALLLLRLHDIGFSTSGVVVGYMVYMFVAMMCAYPAGHFTDRMHPRMIYAMGLIFFAIGYLTLGLTNNHAIAYLGIALYGVFPALTDGVGKAWIGRLSDSHSKGYAQGVFQSSMNFAVLAAGIWGGALWSTGSVENSLVLAGIGALIGAFALTRLRVERSELA
jgi:MFS family permease